MQWKGLIISEKKPNYWHLFAKSVPLWPVVMTNLDSRFQSDSSLTIYYTYDATLEGSNCCQLLEPFQMHLILVQKVGVWNRNCHHLWLKSWGVAMVIPNEFQSWPCLTIYHTYNDTLEVSSCCRMPESIQTHLISVDKWWYVSIAKFVPTRDSETSCDDQFRPQIPIWLLSNHLLYQWWDTGRVKVLSIAGTNPNALDLGAKTKTVTTRDSKVGVWGWLYQMNSNPDLV